jgi:RES domain-containing protein
VRLQGVAYRAHNPKWSWSPLSGEGARLHGGRFNAKGVAALYLSLDWQTAIIEASQGFAYRIPPLTIVSYEVDCDDIADLTSAEERARHRVSEKAMACAWRLLADTRSPASSCRATPSARIGMRRTLCCGAGRRTCRTAWASSMSSGACRRTMRHGAAKLAVAGDPPQARRTYVRLKPSSSPAAQSSVASIFSPLR